MSGPTRGPDPGRPRAQTELPALGIALLLLTVVLVLGIGAANSALTSADRSPLERGTAAGVSDRLVSVDAPVTVRENVFDADAAGQLNGSSLYDRYGLPQDSDARVTLDGDVVASTGPVRSGSRIHRIVLVERLEQRTIRPGLNGSRTVTLPRRSANATLALSPPANTTVRRVWANGHILLANDTGLSGTFEVSLSRLETTQFRFEAIGPLSGSHVRIDYYPPETRKAALAVTVDG
jgi:hypothetical protein